MRLTMENSANHSNHTVPRDNAFQNLYPAIVQCFSIILCGYLAGRLSLISGTQAKGIGTFVSKFALPALVFKSMLELNFTTVNWKFLASLLIGKLIVFTLVMVFTLVLAGNNRMGKAGLFAIFTTQSNDFALGYPIVQALYGKTHPDFAQYLYLAAPISFIVLNPVGFLFLEIDKQRSQGGNVGRKGVIVLHIIKGVITNPIVVMTILGIMANFIFSHEAPAVIAGVLNVLASSFVATALFFLGISLVGKLNTLVGKALIPPALLIFAKLVLLPLIIREFVTILGAGSNLTATQDLGSFGFLYGTIPVAPTVFIYATYYNIVPDLIASGMVVCTFISAPLMFISAQLVTLPQKSTDEYEPIIQKTSFDISILGIICCVWVLVVLTLTRRFRSVPHQMTFCLVIAQMLSCLGMILLFVIDKHVTWQHYVQFILFFVGTMSTRCWTAMIALTLCLLRVRSLCFVLRMRVWIVFFGFGVPILLTGILIMSTRKVAEIKIRSDPLFQYGSVQVIFSSVILLCSAVITVTCLVFQHLYDRHRNAGYAKLEDSHRLSTSDVHDDSENTNSINGNSKITGKRSIYIPKSSSQASGDCNDCTEGCQSAAVNIEDILPDPIRKKRASKSLYGTANKDLTASSSTSSCQGITSPQLSDSSDCSTCSSYEVLTGVSTLSEQTCLLDTGCSQEQRRICLIRVRQHNAATSVPMGDELFRVKFAEYQITRHMVMILLLLLSMFIAIVLCLWRLFDEKISGVYIELQFLDAAFNFGQAFLVFTIFGMETQFVIMPFIKRWRRFWYGAEDIHLPREDDLDEEIKLTKEQFNRYHRQRCIEELVTNKRYRLRVYKSVFTGSELVNWIIRVGLAPDRVEATAYAFRLLLSRVIHHVTREHLFYDLPYFYRFSEHNSIEEDEVLTVECPLTGTPDCPRSNRLIVEAAAPHSFGQT